MDKRKAKRDKKDRKKRAKQRVDDALDAAKTVLDLFSDAAGETGVPGLQTGVGGLVALLTLLKKARANAADIEQLRQKLDGLHEMIKDSTEAQGSVPSESLQKRIQTLDQTWVQVGVEAQVLRSRNPCVRFIKGEADADDIAGLITRVNESIQVFMAQGITAIEIQQGDNHRVMVEHVGEVHRAVGRVEEALSIDLGVLPIAKGARYNSTIERGECLEETRTEVLDAIKAWAQGSERTAIDTAPEVIDLQSKHKIFWLNGLAGTGKTTIAYTVAKWCDKGPRVRFGLGASFFCARSDADCNDASKIFTTIAFQLADFFPPYKKLLADAIRASPSVLHAAAPHHLEDLIVKPIKNLPPGTQFPECLVIIEGMDECMVKEATTSITDKKQTTSVMDKKTTPSIISMLLSHVDDLPSIRFLLTSRPEAHIAAPFNKQQYMTTTGQLPLHNLPLQRVNRDINRYIKTSLTNVPDGFVVPVGWPSEEDVDFLTDRTEGLFIYATTCIRVVFDKRYDDPVGQLSKLLTFSPSNPTSTLLDQLYDEVVASALADAAPELVQRLNYLVGCIVLARVPLTVGTLALLIGWSAEQVRNGLRRFHSVLAVPRIDQPDRTIQMIHATFPEYVVRLQPIGEASNTVRLVINPEDGHTQLAMRCFDAMNLLKRDICDVRDPSLLHTEIPNLSSIVARHIPDHLQYSCRHWPDHFSQARLTDELVDRLREFLHKHLLHWMEACSLTGVLRDALVGIDVCRRKVAAYKVAPNDVINLLDNGERLLQSFYPSITSCSLQIYHSVLSMIPQDTILPKAHDRDRQQSARIVRGISPLWSPCLGMAFGSGRFVASAQFSPDGLTFASAGDGSDVEIWDTISCTLKLTLSGHSRSVRSAQYSHDGTYIVSASWDKTIRVWDAASGITVKVLEGHENIVSTVVFTPNDKSIVSGSSDHSVKIWDVESGTCEATLERHRSWVTSVAVSPNGFLIASGSSERAGEPIYLWDTRDSTSVQSIACSSTGAFVFTPNSKQLVVQECYSPGLDVWDVQTQTRLSRLCGAGFPSQPVACLAVSSDGSRLACATQDYRVLLVDAACGDILRELGGHTAWVYSVSFNLDGTRLLSCSDDTSIRLWDTMPRAADDSIHPQAVNNPSTGPFAHAAFADDGTLLTLGEAGDVDVYHPATWERMPFWRDGPAVQHSPEYGEIFFSPDKTSVIVYEQLEDSVRLELVSMNIRGSTEGQSPGLIEAAMDKGFSEYSPRELRERMWDAICGYARHCFGGASSPMVFSEDGRYLARTTSHDITLYSTTLRQDVLLLTGDSNDVQCVAFSLDGQQLLSGAMDKTIRVWMTHVDKAEGAHPPRSPRLTLIGHKGTVRATAFSLDGTKIVSGSDDTTVRIWDAQSGGCVCTFEGHRSDVTSVAFTPEGNAVFSSSLDNTLRIWDVASQDCLAVFELDAWHNTLRLAPNGSGILVGEGASERLIRMWSTPNTPSKVTASLPWLPSRTWPAYNIDRERWLWSVAPGRKARRMCRIPEDWEEILAFRDTVIVFRGGQILDLSALALHLGI